MNMNQYPNLQRWIDNGCPVYSIRTRVQLNKAEAIIREAREAKAAGIENGLNDDALSSLMADANYAGDRHWTFQWKIIAGAILSVILLSWWGDSKDEEVKDMMQVVAQIEAWTPSDTIVTLESFKNDDGTGSFSYYEKRLNDAAHYKYYYAQLYAHRYYGVQKYIDSEEQRRDRITDPKQKQYAADNVEKLKAEKAENEKKHKSEFERIMSLDFDGVKEMAMKEATAAVEAKASSSRTVKFWFWFLIVCTPLYIVACRPYGYTLTRYAAEADTLNTIHRIGMWLSGGLVGTAAAIRYTEIITKWSDGSKTTSDDGTGPAKMGIKLVLIICAVIVFCAVSCFIMAYATVTGLIRNYDWKAIFGKFKKTKGEPATTN